MKTLKNRWPGSTKALFRWTAILAVLTILVSNLRAEGTKQVMPTNAQGTAMQMSPVNAQGPLLNATTENRLFFYVANHTVENLYFGALPRQRAPSIALATTAYYKIIDPSGAVVAGPTLWPTVAGPGFIANYATAISGPNIGGLNPSGYNPRSFDPMMNGDYYIEIYKSADGGVTMTTGNNGDLFFPYFDFTVAEANNTIYNGRLHTQKWSLLGYDGLSAAFSPGLNFSIEGDYFAYTRDSSVVKIDFPVGFRPLGYILATNSYGVNNSGNFLTDRLSVYSNITAPALPNGYAMFLNSPDPAIYIRSSAATGPTIGATVTGCPGAYVIPYFLDKPGDVTFLIDLNGTAGFQASTTDVLIELFDVAAGNLTLPWNGNDGLGVPVAGGTSVAISAILYRGTA